MNEWKTPLHSSERGVRVAGLMQEVVLNVKLDAVSAAVSVFANAFAQKVFPCEDNHRVIFINTHMHRQVCAWWAVTCDAVMKGGSLPLFQTIPPNRYICVGRVCSRLIRERPLLWDDSCLALVVRDPQGLRTDECRSCHHGHGEEWTFGCGVRCAQESFGWVATGGRGSKKDVVHQTHTGRTSEGICEVKKRKLTVIMWVVTGQIKHPRKKKCVFSFTF